MTDLVSDARIEQGLIALLLLRRLLPLALEYSAQGRDAGRRRG